MTLISYTYGVRHKGLTKKLIMELPATLEEALMMAESYIRLEAIIRRNYTTMEVSNREGKRPIKNPKPKKKIAFKKEFVFNTRGVKSRWK